MARDMLAVMYVYINCPFLAHFVLFFGTSNVKFIETSLHVIDDVAPLRDILCALHPCLKKKVWYSCAACVYTWCLMVYG